MALVNNAVNSDTRGSRMALVTVDSIYNGSRMALDTNFCKITPTQNEGSRMALDMNNSYNENNKGSKIYHSIMSGKIRNLYLIKGSLANESIFPKS